MRREERGIQEEKELVVLPSTSTARKTELCTTPAAVFPYRPQRRGSKGGVRYLSAPVGSATLSRFNIMHTCELQSFVPSLCLSFLQELHVTQSSSTPEPLHNRTCTGPGRGEEKQKKNLVDVCGQIKKKNQM